MYKAILDEIIDLLTNDGRASALEAIERGRIDELTQYKKYAVAYFRDEGPDNFRTNRSKTFTLNPIVTVVAWNPNSASDAYDALLDLLDDNAGDGVMPILRDLSNNRLGGNIESLSVSGVSWVNGIAPNDWLFEAADITLECLVRFSYTDTS